MNRGKRKLSSDKHGRRTINAVLKCCTVPHIDAMKFGEGVKMGHKGSSAGVENNGERRDLRHIAWLLRQKLNDFVDGDQGEPSELNLRSLLNLVASRDFISVDRKMLSPVLWRTLPKELLLLVLARLPLPDITRLCSLSKEWDRDMATL